LNVSNKTTKRYSRSTSKEKQVPPDLSKKVLIRLGDRFNTVIYADATDDVEEVKRKFLEGREAVAANK
jgi:hypothetical protein